MKVYETSIVGLLRIELELHSDERGTFVRVFDRDVFAAHALCTDFPQHGSVKNGCRGIVRGLHYQTAPHTEDKVIRCTSGAVWDVAVDVRRHSPTFGRWEAFDLRAGEPFMLYLSAGLAHGYQTLEDGAELHYLISTPYAPEHAAGVHWLDPDLALPWPLPDASLLSERDRALPTLRDAADGAP